MDLFDFNKDNDSLKPLAERMRPRTLDEFIGQEKIIGKNTLLRRAVTANKLGSCIFYGPPGCGKTTLANIIANINDGHFVKLNAVTAGVAEAKKVIEDAHNAKKMYGTQFYLLLDECHRWNKAQSDSVLQGIESGDIVFIGSTTENPYTSMTKAIVSRCRIFEFSRLKEEDIIKGLKQAATDKERGMGRFNLQIDEQAYTLWSWAANGDLRTALNALELAVLTTNPDADGLIHITESDAQQSIQRKALSYDESMYYDMISAFIKSMRGSDSNAALYWAERLIQGGCDPLLICRRVMIHAAEDVGMADPRALVVATSAMTAFEKLGLPEGRIPLAEAIIYVAEAPKSNSVVCALDSATEAVQNSKHESVPLYLRDPNYKTEKISGYKYPHDFGGWVEQQYLPDDKKDDVYYKPTDHGFEKTIQERQKARKEGKNFNIEEDKK